MAGNPKVALSRRGACLDARMCCSTASLITRRYEASAAPSVITRAAPKASTIARRRRNKRKCSSAVCEADVRRSREKLWDWLDHTGSKEPCFRSSPVCAAACVNTIEKRGDDEGEAADQLASALKLDMADYWQPTVAEVF